MTSLLPTPVLQYLDEDGKPYVGGLLSFFIPGTLTLKNTWQDAGQVTLNTNPVVLDSAGRCVVYGSGGYRVQLRDALDNLIFDQLTDSSLDESAISPVMLPVTEAATLLTARNRMGITQAIADAIAAVDLIPGPTGPTGPQGPVGSTGATGATGTATAASTSSNSNPGYWKDTASGFMTAFGTGVAPSGEVIITFAIPFAGTPNVVATTFGNPINLVLRISGLTNALFSVGIEDTDNSGLRASAFTWIASGF